MLRLTLFIFTIWSSFVFANNDPPCINSNSLQTLEPEKLPIFQQAEGINCLEHQYKGSACACENTINSFTQLLPPEDNSIDEMKKRLNKENEKVLLVAFKKRLMSIIDSAARSDVLMRKNKLNSLDIYRKNKCTIKEVTEKINSLKTQRECASTLKERMKIILDDQNFSSVDEALGLFEERLKKVSALEDHNNSSGNLARALLYQETVSTYSSNAQMALGGASHNINSYINLRIGNNNQINSPAFMESIGRSIPQEIMNEKEKRIKVENSNPIISALLSYRDSDLEKDPKLVEIRSEILKKIGNIFKDGNKWQLDFMTKIKKENPKLSNSEASKRASIEAIKKYNTEFDKIAESREFINLSLGISNLKCGEMLNNKNLEQLFCGDISRVSKETGLKVTTPSMYEKIDKEKEIILAAANYDLYCKDSAPLSPENYLSIKVDHALSPSLATGSFAEELFDGNSDHLDKYSNEIPELISSSTKDGIVDYSEFKDKLVDLISSRCIDNNSCSFGTKEDVEEYLNEAIDNEVVSLDALYMLSPEDQQVLHFGLNIIKEQNLEGENSIVSIITGTDQDKIESGLFTNYTMLANEIDRSNATIINEEIIQADEENREIDQDLINAHAYRPRDIRTGEVIEDAPVVNGLNRVPSSTIAPFQPNISSTTPTERVGSDDREINRTRRDREDQDSNQEDIIDNSISPPSSTEQRIATEKPRINRGSRQRESQQAGASNRTPSRERNQNNQIDREIGRISNWNNNQDAKDRINEIIKQREERIKNLEGNIQRNRKDLFRERTSREDSIRSQIYDAEQEKRRLNRRIRNEGNLARSARDYRDAIRGGDRVSPHSDFGQEDRFPSNIEEIEATSGGEKIVSAQKSGGRGKDTSQIGGKAGGRTPASLGSNSSSLKIKGYESKSLNDCYAPNLHYIYPCFIHVDVLKKIEMVDDFKSRDGRKARENPKTLVHELGLEGKMFATVEYIDDKNEQGDEQVLITSYDWSPPDPNLYRKMDDQDYRNSVIKEIYSKRWDYYFLLGESAKTGIYKEKIVTIGEFNQLMTDRKSEVIVGPTSEHIIENVADMNMRIRKDNKDQVEEVYSEMVMHQ